MAYPCKLNNSKECDGCQNCMTFVDEEEEIPFSDLDEEEDE